MGDEHRPPELRRGQRGAGAAAAAMGLSCDAAPSDAAAAADAFRRSAGAKSFDDGKSDDETAFVKKRSNESSAPTRIFSEEGRNSKFSTPLIFSGTFLGKNVRL